MDLHPRHFVLGAFFAVGLAGLSAVMVAGVVPIAGLSVAFVAVVVVIVEAWKGEISPLSMMMRAGWFIIAATGIVGLFEIGLLQLGVGGEDPINDRSYLVLASIPGGLLVPVSLLQFHRIDAAAGRRPEPVTRWDRK